jgi:23S rRNA (cytosine1962-C5)-methyltransferase
VGYVSDTVFSAKFGGQTRNGELGLPVKSTGFMLPCGAAGRWTPD